MCDSLGFSVCNMDKNVLLNVLLVNGLVLNLRLEITVDLCCIYLPPMVFIKGSERVCACLLRKSLCLYAFGSKCSYLNI